MKSKLCFFIITLCFLFIFGCGEKALEYSFTNVIEENVTYDGYSRNVRIMRFDTNSKHSDEINDALSTKFVNIYNDYMAGKGDTFGSLVIDYTYHLGGDILSVTGIADIPKAEMHTLFSRSIYLDTEKDVLYTAEEYSEILGIDLNAVKEKVSKEISGDLDVEPSFDGLFHHNGDIVFIFSKENPWHGYTVFYNYTKNTYGQASGLGFSGFDSLKIEKAELHFYESDMHIPEQVKLVGKTIHFKNTIGESEPLYFSSFFNRYFAGFYGDISIEKIFVGEAVFEVSPSHYNDYMGLKALNINSISAFGHTLELYNPIVLDGLKCIPIYYTDDYFLFSDNLIITKQGIHLFEDYSNGGWTENTIVTEIFIEYDGSLAYIKRPIKYPIAYNEHRERILKNCTSTDEFCREYGRIRIEDGNLSFVPEKTFTVSEVYDLSAMLDYLYETYDENTVNSRLGIQEKMTLSQLIAYNALKYSNENASQTP